MHPLFRHFPSLLAPQRRARLIGAASLRTDETGGLSSPPFLLENRSENVRPDGGFVPSTRVSLSPHFAASGLLKAVSPDEVVTLLSVLSGVTAGGGFVATPEVLAPALGISRTAMRRRLECLAATAWRGQPLVTELKTESGLRLFVPARQLFEVQRNAVMPIPEGGQVRETLPANAQALPPSRRAESVARSRRLYGRPRAHVEGEIERFLSGQSFHIVGVDAEGVATVAEGAATGMAKGENTITPPRAEERAESEVRHGTQAQEARRVSEGRQWLELKKRLASVGLSQAQSSHLMDNYPFERIERQIGWLPYRDARSPVAYLLAAVAGDYAPPSSLPVESVSPASPEQAMGTAQANEYDG